MCYLQCTRNFDSRRPNAHPTLAMLSSKSRIVLRRADASIEEYAAAMKQVLVATLYTLVCLKIIFKLVTVLGLIVDALALIFWPAIIVGKMLTWCVRG